MVHKFKITSCAFILCLYGLTLMTVPPVFAENDQEHYDKCVKVHKLGSRTMGKGDPEATVKCFRALAKGLLGEKVELWASINRIINIPLIENVPPQHKCKMLMKKMQAVEDLVVAYE